MMPRQNGDLLIKLPSHYTTNHVIFLDKVRVEFRGGLVRTVAYDHTILQNSANQMDFAYFMREQIFKFNVRRGSHCR
jgi:hypothetical protein